MTQGRRRHAAPAAGRGSGGDGRPWPWAGRAVILGTMKGFGKIAMVFGLLGGVMAYFIIPTVQRTPVRG